MKYFVNKEFELNRESAFITLQQLLKFEAIAYSGGAVKAYVEEHLVKVNDVPEARRGRKLYPGDVVILEEPEMTITITGRTRAH